MEQELWLMMKISGRNDQDFDSFATLSRFDWAGASSVARGRRGRAPVNRLASGNSTCLIVTRIQVDLPDSIRNDDGDGLVLHPI